MKFIKSDDWMFTFDLKSGYHHIQIFPPHYTYLGFSFTDVRGVVRYFCFTVLPFGLSSAGFIFSKVLRELIRYWHNNFIKVVLFISAESDDTSQLTVQRNW